MLKLTESDTVDTLTRGNVATARNHGTSRRALADRGYVLVSEQRDEQRGRTVSVWVKRGGADER